MCCGTDLSIFYQNLTSSLPKNGGGALVACSAKRARMFTERTTISWFPGEVLEKMINAVMGAIGSGFSTQRLASSK